MLGNIFFISNSFHFLNLLQITIPCQDIINLIALITRSISDYNHYHNILRLFDVLKNFPFTTSKMMCDYYL